MKYWQNKIAESRFALTTTVVLCVPVWVAAFLLKGYHPSLVLSCVVVALSTYLMAELNTRFALIRIYSRMVSSIFLLLTTMATFPYLSVQTAVSILCPILFYVAILPCYQKSYKVGWGYYAFLVLGIHSLFFPQILYFVPLLLILTTTKLLAMSIRMFFASLLGLLTSYWFYFFYKMWQQDFDGFCSHFTTLATFTNPMEALPLLTLPQMVNAGMVMLCALIGIVHFLHTRQQDRIRTQLFYEIFVTVDFFAILFLLLQPQHYDRLLPIIIVNTAPLTAHFVALTATRWTNLLTKLLLWLTLLITLFNIARHTSLATLLPDGIPL